MDDYASLKDEGVKVILAPKTYGPFVDSESASMMKELLDEYVDLIYCRDTHSLSTLSDLGLSPERLHYCPDYTAVIESEPHLGNACLVLIPSCRFEQRLGPKLGEDYLNGMCDIARYFKKEEVVVLCHTQGDLEIARRLSTKANVEMKYVNDALAAKRYIGCARLVVSSRYHGILNALHSETPVVSVGWTFKYGELMSEYGLEAYSFGVESIRDALSAAIELWKSEPLCQQQIETMRYRNREKSPIISNMFDEIYQCVS